MNGGCAWRHQRGQRVGGWDVSCEWLGEKSNGLEKRGLKLGLKMILGTANVHVFFVTSKSGFV